MGKMNVHTTVWGIGNPLLCDDAAGLEVIRLLEELAPEGFFLRSCELAPGNFLSTLRRESPKRFFLVDASDMGLPPGSVRRLPLDRIDDPSFTSHDFPINRLLEDALPQDCVACVIAIQPTSTDFHMGLTPAVAEAAQTCATLLAEGRSAEIPELEGA